MAPPLVCTLFSLEYFFWPFLGACLYVGTTPQLSSLSPGPGLGQTHLCAVSLAPCLPLVG